MIDKFCNTALFSAGIVLASATMAPAQSLDNCAPRDTLVERLSTKYGETRQSIGLGSNNAVMEVFASRESGSWTITVTMANGVTCLVASGQAFEATADMRQAQGDPA